ncbi:antitoxin [Massilia violaceinigra]|uniref:Antitoxin n=1 Tax=Massilia violaceinigra TaxID=2045208 RepID=A0A2D2DLA0_9BURK|nr:antitoxin Xre/MbcA/ParS toxin-binding domain-containing protein [Massilia violaceinigra]ATQ75767.1 antitoxin [Massilia violaceinigra]
MKAALARDTPARVVAESSIATGDLAKFPQTVMFLGGEEAMKRKIETKLDVHVLIMEGFPNAVMTFLIESIPELKNPEFLQKTVGMSKRTSQRRHAADKLLTSEQSSKAWNFAEVMTQASAVFGSKEEGVRWLGEPALALEGRRPLDLLLTSAGYDLVKDLLTRLEYGVYA